MQEELAIYVGLLVIGAPITMIALLTHSAFTGGTTIAMMMTAIGALALLRNFLQPREQLPKARIARRPR